ncbi:RING-type E3 ubiquitin transferase [Melia azedarach]|uniref:RING-type E3 ubiquitin transferase n=1 Tax=Melia azedarach TaxID=155640 RepID=A0ACC1XVG9_MELAZ|nr:RING-type E3 ubiquitin transferase [Melia azedarach]
MVRDDLYITIPSFFRCPISLDVMKSPVSLCTGVTYDRASIQRWLDSGNNTCPATMQVLQSKEFVPNRTLQRLIQIWSESVQKRVDSTESTNSVLTQDQVKDIIRVTDIKNEDLSENLSKLIAFAKESDENKKFLAKFDGLVVMLVEILRNVKDVNILREVIRILDLILNKLEDQQQLMNLILKRDQDCLNSLLLVVKQQENVDSRIESLRILEFIALDAESKILIAEKDGLLAEIMKSLDSDADRTLIEVSLSCLIAISSPKRVKTKLITCHRVICHLRKLITDRNATVSTTEKVLKLIETMCSSKQGRMEICQDSALLHGVVQKMLKVSSAATEHAVTILWSVCYLFREQTAQEALTSGNVLTKILLLMQSNCSPAVRQMSADLLKIFRVNYKSCLSNPEIHS